MTSSNQPLRIKTKWIIAIFTTLVTAGSIIFAAWIDRPQPQIITSTPTAIFQPTSTSALPVQTPTSLYVENGSDNWNGWTGTSDWKIFNGMLLNDGTNYCCGSQPTITAPYQVQGIANYAVEVIIQVNSYPQDYTACFDITLRGI